MTVREFLLKDRYFSATVLLFLIALIFLEGIIEQIFAIFLYSLCCAKLWFLEKKKWMFLSLAFFVVYLLVVFTLYMNTRRNEGKEISSVSSVYAFCHFAAWGVRLLVFWLTVAFSLPKIYLKKWPRLFGGRNAEDKRG